MTRRPLAGAALFLGAVGAVAAVFALRGPADFKPRSGDANCGTLALAGQAVYLETGPPDAESCLASAAARCHPAALTLFEQGVDTGSTQLFEVDAHSGCGITDYRTYSGIHGSQSTTTCSAAAYDPTAGLTIRSCGGQDITIANPVNLPTYPGRTMPPPADAGVRGTAVEAQCYPHASADPSAPCAYTSSLAHVVVRDTHGVVVAEQTTGLDGTFALALLPGQYEVDYPYRCDATPPATCPVPRLGSGSTTVTVAPRHWGAVRVIVYMYRATS
jgi:hypothetical protein